MQTSFLEMVVLFPRILEQLSLYFYNFSVIYYAFSKFGKFEYRV
jgi:hypothetical protein